MMGLWRFVCPGIQRRRWEQSRKTRHSCHRFTQLLGRTRMRAQTHDGSEWLRTAQFAHESEMAVKPKRRETRNSRLGKAGFRLPFPWRSGDTHAARYFSLLLEKPPLSHITHVTRAGAQRGRDAVRSRPPVHHGAAFRALASQSAAFLVLGCSGPSDAVKMASARSSSGLASACLACL